jgi:hypothetical protein
MNFLTPLALLSAVASWAFIGLTFSNLLSGYFETRSCLTDCVKNYYFLAAGFGFAGIALGFLALLRSGISTWPVLILLFTALPFGITAGIFTIGTLGSSVH